MTAGNKIKTSPNVRVGIMTVSGLSFRLSGKYSLAGMQDKFYDAFTAKVEDNTIVIRNQAFSQILGDEAVLVPCNINTDYFELRDVLIGVDFHWEQKEDQRFRGALKLLRNGDKIIAINIIPVEDYLKSVISSEMRADASVELLKAHAIIARSWLLSKLESQKILQDHSESTILSDNEREYIRWWDTDDHEDFDVCADDHCQRYQGISRMTNSNVIEAVNQTMGMVLYYEDGICDARYSKSCGGQTEVFASCWGDAKHEYLMSFSDTPDKKDNNNNLTDEAQAEKFIMDSPECFCNTSDDHVLKQVLNDYDRETRDFFRWNVLYMNKELSDILRKRSGHDFGSIRSLVPVKRGPSGRLVLLKIEGTKKSMLIGKELVIRKWLSSSHLYSSAFIIKEGDKDEKGIPVSFELIGAGWGHGVGLCQIGAAVMGENGYKYYEILQHYYPGAELKKMYV